MVKQTIILITFFLTLTLTGFGQVKYETDLFDIYFPTEPDEKVQKITSGKKKIKLFSLSSTGEDDRTYTVNYYKYPENISGYRPITILKSTAEGFIEQKTIKVESELDIFKHKRIEGMEFIGYSKSEKKYYNYQIFLYKEHIIQLAIVSENSIPNKKVAKNFFKGIQFN